MTSLHESAMRYADLGYAVFACVPGGKEPLCARGCLEATTDLDRIDAWWTQRPNANIGLATNGLLVVDIDQDATWLADDAERAHDLAVAPLSLTAGGGKQYFYRQPDGAGSAELDAGEYELTYLPVAKCKKSFHRHAAGQTMVWTDVCLENRGCAIAIRRTFRSWRKALIAAGLQDG